MQINKCLLNYRQTNDSSSVKSKGKVFCVNKEWEEIFKTVKKDAVSYDKVKNILPIIQLNNYRWNYIRIDKKYKDEKVKKVKIAIVGKYIKLEDSYLSVVESIKHAGYANEVDVEIGIIYNIKL